MCGIAGFAGRHPGFVPQMARLKAMCDTIVHRGPDGEGVGIAGHVALGMRRLSIIDIEGGSQPIFNEDRTVRVTLNGEIYNYRDLRRELEAAGHRFYTHSDTEVIVHAYEEFGDDFTNRLNGMFAIALHDSARNRLILARDQLGIKPLFYAITPDAVIWGSEIKAILASDMVSRTLDPTALVDFCPGSMCRAKKPCLGDPQPASPAMSWWPKPGGTHRRTRYWDFPTSPEHSGRSNRSGWSALRCGVPRRAAATGQ